MSHTPGTWKWWTSNSYRRLIASQDGRDRVVAEAYVCTDDAADIAISEADMRLTETAPSLLAALKETRKAAAIMARIIVDNRLKPEQVFEGALDLIGFETRADEAIAKTEGQG